MCQFQVHWYYDVTVFKFTGVFKRIFELNRQILNLLRCNETRIEIHLLVLSLCAASRMWVRHRSVVIVPPEGGLEFSAGFTKKIVFYSCHG